MDKAGLPYSHVRPQGEEHIPIYPQGFIGIRIVQLVLAVIIMALASYTIHFLAWDGNTFILTCAIMTVITSIYHLVVKFGDPRGYNYWAVLSLDMLLVVLWLSSFALLASQTSTLFTYYNSYSYSYNYYYGYVKYTSRGDLIYLSILAAASALGGVQFALHVVSLVIHSIRLHRHRQVGLHCMPGQPRTIPGEPTPAPAYAAPQQQPQFYTQQPPQQPHQTYYPPQQAYYPQQAQQPTQQYASPQQQPAQPQPQTPPYGGATQLPTQ